jgi:antitoxin component YwqK of YwqJK toxin-antitoxin module
MSFKCSFSPLSKNFRITALIVLLCTIVVVDGYAQFMYSLDNDTLLKPDTNNVVRTAYPDSIVYSYYFDNAHSKLRSKYMYSIDPKDRREVIFIQTYCFLGQKVFEETYKNYNRILKTPDTNFTIQKLFIAYNGREADPLITDTEEPFRQYSQVGACLHWYCNGNRRDSTWFFPTKKFAKYESFGRETVRYRKNIAEQRGVGYSWYESGNIAEEWYYQNGEVTMRLVYVDSTQHKLLSRYVAAKNKDPKGATDLMCHYFPNGNLEDSVISDSKFNQDLESYTYYKNGLKKSVIIDRPGFKVTEFYDSTGHPRDIERKAMYKGKWYGCEKRWFDNGQLSESVERQQFYILHPEYGSLPDSLIFRSESYLSNGTRSYFRYTLKNGDTYSFLYRENGTLLKMVFFNSKKLGTETEYDENGIITNQKKIDLNNK